MSERHPDFSELTDEKFATMLRQKARDEFLHHPDLVEKTYYWLSASRIDRLRAENAELRGAINVIYAHTLNAVNPDTLHTAIRAVSKISHAILAKTAKEEQ